MRGQCILSIKYSVLILGMTKQGGLRQSYCRKFFQKKFVVVWHVNDTVPYLHVRIKLQELKLHVYDLPEFCFSSNAGRLLQ